VSADNGGTGCRRKPNRPLDQAGTCANADLINIHAAEVGNELNNNAEAALMAE
jgi:hypothetical protein